MEDSRSEQGVSAACDANNGVTGGRDSQCEPGGCENTEASCSPNSSHVAEDSCHCAKSVPERKNRRRVAVVQNPHVFDKNDPMQFELEKVHTDGDSGSREHNIISHNGHQQNQSESSHNKLKGCRPRFHHSNSWKEALKKAQVMPDPWEKFHIDESCPVEVAVRHRYNVLKKHWVKDEVRVKMEKVPFDQGAMRMCFRLKKLSNFTHHMNWKHAANYVAKHYIEEVPREVYLDDVRLQMNAKLWGEEFSRHDPPKKVDIFQTYIIEMKEREGSPLFHLEHFIEGQYTKYNSNSGFVLRDEALRSTPQAFSHFTYERSGHQLIVVDIQGVGDLYTDPQIHTADGTEYGDANLGPRGMALFFSSHQCNKICDALGLSPFDLSEKEIERISISTQNVHDSTTVVRSSSFEENIISPASLRKMSAIFDITPLLHLDAPPPVSSETLPVEPDSPRKMSAIFDITEYALAKSPPESPRLHGILELASAVANKESQADKPEVQESASQQNLEKESPDSPVSELSCNSQSRSPKVSFGSFKRRHSPESGDSSASETESDYSDVFTENEEEERRSSQSSEGRLSIAVGHMHKASSVHFEAELMEKLRAEQEKKARKQKIVSCLGQVHLELAKYNEIGRFTDEPDVESALFHLEKAAMCGVTDAILTMAEIYLDLPHEMLSSASIQPNETNTNRGVEYMVGAAERGERQAMVYLAKSYESGEGLGTNRSRSWLEAAKWYQNAIEVTEDDEEPENTLTTDPNYLLHAKQAELYRQGGWGLEKEPSYAGELYSSAGDLAMASMKGKLANKYFAFAEECWAECED